MTAIEPLGMVKGQPELVGYDDRWPKQFLELRASLYEALQDRILSVHHVGSTAVPGLAAKPILDVLIGVAEFDAALEFVPLLENLGVEFRPNDDIPDRHFFRVQRDGLRTHNLSLAVPTSRHFVNSLVFRDALRESPELAREYEALKVDLLQQYYDGRHVTDGKTEFVRGVLASHGGVSEEETG